MVETYQEQQTEDEELTFEVGQEVTVQDLRQIVAPQNTPDEVEKRRLQMIGSHVNELLKEDLQAYEMGVHRTSLYNLGAEVVLEYLPDRPAA